MTDIPAAIREALIPTPCGCPKVTLERVEVTGAGMVKGVTDTEGRPVDGNTGTSGYGSVLTVGGQRIFIPYATGV